RESRFRGVGVAAEFQLQAIGKPELPGQARAEGQPLDRARERRKELREAREAARNFRFAPGRTTEERQLGWGFAGEALSLLVDEAACRPACERHVLLDAHFEAIGPYAAHRRAPHPGQPLERRAQLVDWRGEEVAAADTCQRARHLGARRLL